MNENISGFLQSAKSIKRIIWVDIAKGIGIFLVIFSHSKYTTNYIVYINTFYMGLFFILSGCTYRKRSISNSIKRKIKTILMPYLFFSITLFGIKCFLHGYSISSLIGIIWGRYSILKGGIRILDSYNGPLWFLTTFFVFYILYSIIDNSCNNRYLRMTVVAMLSISAYFIGSRISLYIPWGIDIAMTMLVFMELGRILPGIMKKIAEFKLLKVLLFLSCIIILIIITNLNGRVNVSLSEYGDSYFLYLIGSISGSLIVILLSIWLEKLKYFCRILKYIGSNTRPIMAYQMVLLAIVERILIKIALIDLNTYTIIKDTGFIGIIQTIIVLFLFSILLLLYNYLLTMKVISRSNLKSGGVSF